MNDDMPRPVTVTDERLLEELSDTDGCPVKTVPELTDNLPIGKDATRSRLKKLVESGEVRCRHVGARASVWWVED